MISVSASRTGPQAEGRRGCWFLSSIYLQDMGGSGRVVLRIQVRFCKALRSRKLERAPQGWDMRPFSAQGTMGAPAPLLWTGVSPQAAWLLANKPVETNFQNILRSTQLLTSARPGPGAVGL